MRADFRPRRLGWEGRLDDKEGESDSKKKNDNKQSFDKTCSLEARNSRPIPRLERKQSKAHNSCLAALQASSKVQACASTTKPHIFPPIHRSVDDPHRRNNSPLYIPLPYPFHPSPLPPLSSPNPEVITQGSYSYFSLFSF